MHVPGYKASYQRLKKQEEFSSHVPKPLVGPAFFFVSLNPFLWDIFSPSV
jgi:hypothetical protein